MDPTAHQSPAINPRFETRVDSCVCTGVSFEEIKQAAGGREAGLLDAHRTTGCAGKCGLCLPYIKLMLNTGETSLPVMWSEAFTKAGINPGRVKVLELAIKRQQAEMDKANTNT